MPFLPVSHCYIVLYTHRKMCSSFFFMRMFSVFCLIIRCVELQVTNMSQILQDIWFKQEFIQDRYNEWLWVHQQAFCLSTSFLFTVIKIFDFAACERQTWPIRAGLKEVEWNRSVKDGKLQFNDCLQVIICVCHFGASSKPVVMAVRNISSSWFSGVEVSCIQGNSLCIPVGQNENKILLNCCGVSTQSSGWVASTEAVHSMLCDVFLGSPSQSWVTCSLSEAASEKHSAAVALAGWTNCNCFFLLLLNGTVILDHFFVLFWKC